MCSPDREFIPGPNQSHVRAAYLSPRGSSSPVTPRSAVPSSSGSSSLVMPRSAVPISSGSSSPVTPRSAVPSSSGSSSLVTTRSAILSIALVMARKAVSSSMEVKSLTSIPVLWWSSTPSGNAPAPVFWWSSSPPWLPLFAPPWLPLSPPKSHYGVRTCLWGGGSTITVSVTSPLTSSVTSPELHFPAARLVYTCTLSPISTPVTDHLIPPRYIDCHQSHHNCLVSLQFL